MRTAITGNSYCTPLVMQEWLHAVAGLDPFCVGEPFSDSERSATLPAGSIVWLQVCIRQLTWSKYYIKRRIYTKFGDPAAPERQCATASQCSCARRGERQAGLSVSLHFEKLLCFHAEGRALRVWRCCRVTASRAFPVRPLWQTSRLRLSPNVADCLIICYISFCFLRQPCCESAIRLL